MGSDLSGRERRQHKRFVGKSYGVMFRKLVRPPETPSAEYFAAKSIDISKGGMRFLTVEKLEEDDRIEYFVHSASGKSGREGTATVLRVEQAGELCKVAVAFQM